jgi:hypothetical protein
MSANRMFLVCSHHPQIEDALCLADRADQTAQYTVASVRRADEWFAKHSGCGRGCDHFQLAFHRPQNWDTPKIADPIPTAVRLALVQR